MVSHKVYVQLPVPPTATCVSTLFLFRLSIQDFHKHIFHITVPSLQIHKKDMVVIGWNVDQTVEGLVSGLGDFAPPGSTVTIVSPDEPDDLPSECGNCRCRHLEGSVASRQVLLEVQYFAWFWREA